MKNVFSIILLLFCFSAEAQTANTNLKNDKNIYYRALFEYTTYLNNNHASLSDTLFIEDDFKLGTDSILSQIGKIKLINLNGEELVKIFNYKKAITLYRIFPLKVDKNIFSVSFIPFGVTYNKSKRHFFYTNGGGYEVDFEYKDNGFKFIRVVGYGL